jgi:IS5 family transposase
VDRGKGGIKRSTMVDAKGIPLAMVAAGANRHDSPLLAPTLDAAREASIELPEHATVHLDRAYDSKLTRRLLESRGLVGVISEKGKPAPLTAALRWVVERTNSWQAKLAHKKLAWCTEREDRVIGFWISFSNVIIIVRRLIREGWIRYRWEGRPSRKP